MPKAKISLNKAVYSKFEQTAFSLIEGRHKSRISAKAIFELLRIVSNLKIDNCDTPYYARAFAERNKKYKNCFIFRQVKKVL